MVSNVPVSNLLLRFNNNNGHNTVVPIEIQPTLFHIHPLTRQTNQLQLSILISQHLTGSQRSPHSHSNCLPNSHPIITHHQYPKLALSASLCHIALNLLLHSSFYAILPKSCSCNIIYKHQSITAPRLVSLLRCVTVFHIEL